MSHRFYVLPSVEVIEFNSLRSSKKLRKINDCMGGNCLTAALMLFQEPHPSSKLGDVPLKTPCIIFLMMSPPKQSQKIIQSYRLPWRSYRLPWRSCCLPWSYCPPWGMLNGGSESRRGMEEGVYKLSVVRHKE